MTATASDNEVGEWFEEYGNSVYQFLVYLTGRSDVEDMVQDTFLRAVKHRHKYRGDASPKTWLLSIARNLAIDQLRKEKHKRFVSDETLNVVADTGVSVEETVSNQVMMEAIIKVLHRLKPAYRLVLILRNIHDLSSKETASVLGWTVSKVNVTHHRALQAAKKLLISERKGLVPHESR